MKCLINGFTTFDLLQDGFHRSGPDKGFGVEIVGLEIVLNGLGQFGNTMERATSNAFLSQLTKPAFHQVEPGRAGGDKMQAKAWVSPQPLLDLGVFVGAIIVEDQVQIQPGREFSVQASEEL